MCAIARQKCPKNHCSEALWKRNYFFIKLCVENAASGMRPNAEFRLPAFRFADNAGAPGRTSRRTFAADMFPTRKKRAARSG